MEKRIYPTLPTAPPEDGNGNRFNSYSARTKFEDLRKKKEYLEKKRKSYDKKLDATILVNRLASGIGHYICRSICGHGRNLCWNSQYP